MSGVCDVPVVSTVCDTAGDASSSLAAAPFDWLSGAMGEAAAWMFEAVWHVFDSTTLVDVTNSEFTSVYNLLFGVAIFVMLAFFVLQVVGGMVRREPAALSRAALGLGKSILGSFVVLTLLAAALEITDRLCLGIVHASGTTMEEMGGRITLLVVALSGLNVAAPGVGSVITIFIGGLAIGAAAMVWISLLIRKALLLIAIVFAPIAFAGASWDHTRGWVSKWASFVLALIVSKVVVVVIFLLATAQVSAPIDADLQSLSEPMSGIVLMLVAGFAPYLSYKAISFMGFDSYHAMSAEQEAKSALQRPLPTSLSSGSPLQAPKVLGGSEGAASDVAPPRAPAGSAGSGAPATRAAGSSAAGGSGAAAAAGPAAAVVVGATTVKSTASAGPAVGAAVGRQTDEHSNQASRQPDPAPSAPGPPPLDPSPDLPTRPDDHRSGS